MRLFCLFCLLISLWAYASEGMDASCNQGNFALSSSQIPGPLVGFGENIISQNQIQLFLFGDDYVGQRKNLVDLIPGILYGITDDFSVFLNVPVAPSYKQGKQHSSGLEDLFVQFEYAPYTKMGFCSIDQWTIVANVSVPTGSSRKRPPTGAGAVSYFVGTTYNRTWIDWFLFTACGVELPMAHCGSRTGNQYLYQFGVGRNIVNAWGWIFAWMFEVDGTFTSRNKVNGRSNFNSGGNVIYATPSFWASSERWILQGGLGYAVQQNLFGRQKRNELLAVFNVGITL